MARGLTAAMLAELAKDHIRPAFFVEIEFSSGVQRMWSGVGDFVWNSQTFSGVGHFGGISPVKESGEVVASNFILSLSGIPSSLLGLALSEIRHNKRAKVWFALLDENGAVISDPVRIAKGFTDRAEIQEAGDFATIRLNCETQDAQLQRAKERRWTPEDQKAALWLDGSRQQTNPSDKGFDDVPALAEINLVWGEKPLPQATGPSGGGGGGGGRDRGPRFADTL